MSTNAQADEVPFLAGMEREGQVCETTIEVGKKAFQLDGVLDRLLEKARAAMEARSPEQGPLDYPERDLDVHVPKIAISGGGGYKPHGDRTRRNSIIDALLIAGIIALVSTSIYLLKTTVKLETSYTERGTLYDERFRGIRDDNLRQDAELRRHDERIDRLEQQRRDAQPNPDNQQGNR